MKKRLIISLFIIYCIAFICAIKYMKQTNNQPIEEENITMVSVDSEIIPLEEYVIRVVASEMPSSFELEALKAQAVAARTFAYSRGFSLSGDNTSQVCLSLDKLANVDLDKIRLAVTQTKNEIITYENKPISALYFSSSNGYTVNSENYFQNSLPYLKSVASTWDNDVNPNNTQTKFISNNEFKQAMNIDNIEKIEIISRYDDNHVKEVKVNGISYTGRQIRELLNLRSTDFSINKIDEGIIFTTIGYGHGVGMSQYGANGMAKQGYNYQQILSYYYQNIEIKDMDSIK